MQKLLNYINDNKSAIESELTRDGRPDSLGFVERFGYEPMGIIRLPYSGCAVMVGRRTAKEPSDPFTQMAADGYLISEFPARVGGREFTFKLVSGKEFSAGDGAVAERPGTARRKPVAFVGHSGGHTVMGLFTNTPPEHYGDVQRIAELYGMEPITAIPDAFLKALKEPEES